MPIDFLTPAERDPLNHFPEPIPAEDLRVFLPYPTKIRRKSSNNVAPTINWALRSHSVRCAIWVLPPMTLRQLHGLP
jgi:hypothetical protein